MTSDLLGNPIVVEVDGSSEADDEGARTGAVWVNPTNQKRLNSETDAANARLRHYFTDIDEAIEKWGVFGGDKKVTAKTRVIIRKIEAALGAKVSEMYFPDNKAYLAVVLDNSKHQSVAFIQRTQINHRIELKGSLPTISLGKEFFYSALPSFVGARSIMKETPAPAHRTCAKCGSPVPPTRGCDWCPEDNL
jgi:hypothetical protein